MTFSTDTARPELTWDLMNDVECVEVTEGWSSQDAVAEVQVVDVHHTQVQELEEDTGESVSGFGLRNFFLHSCPLTCAIWMYFSWENCGTRKFSSPLFSCWASTWAYSFSQEMGVSGQRFQSNAWRTKRKMWRLRHRCKNKDICKTLMTQ